MSITVEISQARLVAFGNEVHAGLHILKKLRDEGIPAVGVLFPRGVETGVLEIAFDDLMDVWTYTWRKQ